MLCVFKSSGCGIDYSPLLCSCRRPAAPLGRIAAEQENDDRTRPWQEVVYGNLAPERVDSACLGLDVTSERRNDECRLKRGKADRAIGHREQQGLLSW
jgi:hypothetical protein